MIKIQRTRSLCRWFGVERVYNRRNGNGEVQVFQRRSDGSGEAREGCPEGHNRGGNHEVPRV